MADLLPNRMNHLAAVISSANFDNRRGLINASLNRIEYLEKTGNFHVDVFALKIVYADFSLCGFLKGEFFLKEYEHDGRRVLLFTKIEYRSRNRIIGKPLSIYHKVRGYRNSDWNWHKKFAHYLKGYDGIIAHSNDAAFVAKTASKRYGIPFFVTWHGSDIHTTPFCDKNANKITIAAIESAACNFFVSNSLKEKSDLLTIKGEKQTLYNGIAREFYCYSLEMKKVLKKRYDIGQKKVVTFAGNLIDIKNVLLLPSIFKEIDRGYCGDIVFWIIGDGKLKQSLLFSLADAGLNYCYWGSRPHEQMPDFFNCTDVLVLPSKNEGLPLVTLEAMACGANVVGSQVGGITEAIGVEYSIPFSDSFLYDFADKVVSCLKNPCMQRDLSGFSWEKVAEKESEIIKRMIHG